MKALYKATFWIFMAFCAGGLLGGSVSYLYLDDSSEDSRARSTRSERPRGGDPDENAERSKRFLTYLESRLDLDEEQKSAVWKILLDSRDQYRAIDKQAHKDSSKVREQSRQKIMDVLRPEQVEEFNKMIEERHKGHSDKGRKEKD